MIARNHEKCSLALWLAGASPVAAMAAAAAGRLHPLPELDLATYAVLAVVACGFGVGPDLDKPPEGNEPGATPVEAFGPVGHAASRAVVAVCGHHRNRRHWWSTHRFTCGYALGILWTVAAVVAPRPALVLALTLAVPWIAYLVLPYRYRDLAWAVGLAAAGAAWFWAPAGPWTGLAVAAGWCAHIACDRLQSALFRLGGPVEWTAATASLAAAGYLALTHHP